MIWTLNVIIAYNDNSWESAEYVKDTNGFRHTGPDVVGLPQLAELFSSLNIATKSNAYYRQDYTSVSYRFSALAANGYVNVAGGVNSYFISNNLNSVTESLESDTDFAQSFILSAQPYIFDYDYSASLFPLYLGPDVKIGSSFRNYGELSGFSMRWSALIQDLSGVNWVVGFDSLGEDGRLFRLDNNYNILNTYEITGGLGEGSLITNGEPIKVVAYDNDRFLLIQEDANAYYLSKTGTLTDLGVWSLEPSTSDDQTQPDPLSLFRYNDEIYCLFESTISVGKWNSGSNRFDNIGELQLEGVTESDMLDVVGIYYIQSTGKYAIFTNDDTNGWRYSLLSMPSLVVEPVQQIFGFDDDIMFVQGPAVTNSGIGYGSPIFGYVKGFYNRNEGLIDLRIPVAYLKTGITAADLVAEYNFASGPTTELTINSMSLLETGYYSIILTDPDDFDSYIIRVKYRSDAQNNYLYLDWD